MRDAEILRLISAADEAADFASAPLHLADAPADCPVFARLHAAASGAAVPPEISAHCAACPRCAARLAAFGRGNSAADSAAAARARRLRRIWRIERAVLATAAAAVWVGAFVLPRAMHRGPTLHATPPIIAVADASPVCRPCDANCDDTLNLRDIDAFILALLYPGQYRADYPHCDILCSADYNRNCQLDEDDIDGLVACVVNR